MSTCIGLSGAVSDIANRPLAHAALKCLNLSSRIDPCTSPSWGELFQQKADGGHHIQEVAQIH